MKKKKVKHTCPDCDVKIRGLWRPPFKCSDCGGTGNNGADGEDYGECLNCLGDGLAVCCRCEGTGVDPYPDEN